MKKKTPNPVRKKRSERGKKPAERPELSPEAQEQIRLGRELMAEYRQVLAMLAKS